MTQTLELEGEHTRPHINFKRPPLYCVRQKANINVFVRSEKMSDGRVILFVW